MKYLGRKGRSVTDLSGMESLSTARTLEMTGSSRMSSSPHLLIKIPSMPLMKPSVQQDGLLQGGIQIHSSWLEIDRMAAPITVSRFKGSIAS